MEQEIASTAAFILAAADHTNPYYHNVPEKFKFPAVYFPSPEITTGGETFRTYRMEFAWYITFHHSTSEGAYELAHAALSAIMGHRCLIPLLNKDGSKAGGYLRIDTASVKGLDAGVFQLALTFVSRRPYFAEVGETVNKFFASLHAKSTEPGESVADYPALFATPKN